MTAQVRRFQLRMMTTVAGSLIACSWFPSAASAAAAAAICTPTERKAADAQLLLNKRDKTLSLSQNLPWGAPVSREPVTHERLLIQHNYVIDYDGDLRVPIWTAERVVGSDLGKVGRSDCFRTDPRLTSDEASTPADYSEPIFDQGHVTPSADLTTSKISVHNSFIMSNMTPQFCQFNRGVWQMLEDIVRRWAAERGTIYVTSGSVFDRDNNSARDPDDAAPRMLSKNQHKRVAIPSAFYKVVAIKRPTGGIETLAILMPNDQTDLDGTIAITYLGQHVTNIAAIERLTGLDLFPQAAGPVAEDQVLWPFKGKPPRSLAKGSVQCHKTAGAVIR
jgi:endonuclease G